MRAVGYCRVSTEDQSREGISLDAQRAKLEAWAAFEGAELVAIEVDAGISAKTIEGRPGLLRALDMLRTGAADGLVVVKLDRLTRSVRNLGELIDTTFRTAQLVSLGEKIDTQSAGGRMMLNVLSSVSQWEREVAAERTSAAMQHLRTINRVVGSVPYGFRDELGEDGKRRLTQDLGEQAVMTEARRLRASGLTLRAVAAELERAGMVSRNGRRFDPSQVRILLREAA